MMSRILIIDDDIITLQFFRYILESCGYEVIQAFSGKEGIAMLHKQPADLVITDIFMPVMDGFETILKLRQEFPKLKILVSYYQ